MGTVVYDGIRRHTCGYASLRGRPAAVGKVRLAEQGSATPTVIK